MTVIGQPHARPAHPHEDRLITGGLFFGPARAEEIRNREVVEEIIDFLEIQAIRKKVVGTLAYGLQKRVELGRALALGRGCCCWTSRWPA